MATLEEHVKKRGPRSYDAHRIRHGGRCIWLSPQGRRCRATATWAGSMHGDEHLQDGAWVWVEACERHAEILFRWDTWYGILKVGGTAERPAP